jgi:flagellar biosynthesis protein FlhB
MSEQDSDDKTEEATPERRKKSRDEGQFPRARDTGAIAATIAVLGGLLAFGGDLIGVMRELALRCFGHAHSMLGGGVEVAGLHALTALALLTLPIAALAAVAAIALGLAEAGFEPRLELAAPKFERLDPIGKLGQLLSPKEALTNVMLPLLRVVIVGAVAYKIAEQSFPMLVRLSGAELSSGAHELVGVLSRLALWATLSLAILSAADYGLSWFRHEKQIRMSRQEIKEEHHQQEGDPKIKAKQRARAREIAKRGIRKELKGADVVVTNPTHVAVALRYNANDGAPVVATKGYDEIALFIRKVAGEYKIPIVENKPLARALAERVRAGRMIPVDLYVAVAEVLAFVYRLKQRGRRA